MAIQQANMLPVCADVAQPLRNMATPAVQIYCHTATVSTPKPSDENVLALVNFAESETTPSVIDGLHSVTPSRTFTGLIPHDLHAPTQPPQTLFTQLRTTPTVPRTSSCAQITDSQPRNGAIRDTRTLYPMQGHIPYAPTFTAPTPSLPRQQRVVNRDARLYAQLNPPRPELSVASLVRSLTALHDFGIVPPDMPPYSVYDLSKVVVTLQIFTIEEVDDEMRYPRMLRMV
jgi:hypothetical protein